MTCTALWWLSALLAAGNIVWILNFRRERKLRIGMGNALQTLALKLRERGIVSIEPTKDGGVEITLINQEQS